VIECPNTCEVLLGRTGYDTTDVREEGAMPGHPSDVPRQGG
jgi:hypothetical protein